MKFWGGLLVSFKGRGFLYAWIGWDGMLGVI